MQAVIAEADRSFPPAEVVAEEEPDAYTTKLEEVDSEMRLPSEHFSFDEADSFLEGRRRPLPSSEMELLLESHEDVVRRNHVSRIWLGMTLIR